MSEQIARSEWCCLDRYDISGQAENFGFKRSLALQESTTFPDPSITSDTAPIYTKRLTGAESAMLDFTGTLDTSLLGNLEAFKSAFSASVSTSFIVTKGEGRALGSFVHMFKGRDGVINYGGPVGNIIPVTANIMNDGPVTMGRLYEFGTKSATGNGTSRTTTAVAAGMVRTIHIHVLSVAGTSTPGITVIYETSAIGNYSDAVTRWTSSAVTAANIATLGAQRAYLTATVSDTNGRFRWTITGTTPAFVVRFSEGVR